MEITTITNYFVAALTGCAAIILLEVLVIPPLRRYWNARAKARELELQNRILDALFDLGELASGREVGEADVTTIAKEYGIDLNVFIQVALQMGFEIDSPLCEGLRPSLVDPRVFSNGKIEQAIAAARRS